MGRSSRITRQSSRPSACRATLRVVRRSGDVTVHGDCAHATGAVAMTTNAARIVLMAANFTASRFLTCGWPFATLRAGAEKDGQETRAEPRRHGLRRGPRGDPARPAETRRAA